MAVKPKDLVTKAKKKGALPKIKPVKKMNAKTAPASKAREFTKVVGNRTLSGVRK